MVGRCDLARGFHRNRQKRRQWHGIFFRRGPLPDGVEVLFSPSFDAVRPRDLAEWILADRLAVRMQIQLHKILWGNEPGR